MEKGKHQVGYSGKDSMREKAQRLFGNAVQGVDMTDVLSASAPSKTPMRKYAKGGHVKSEQKVMREGSMLPKSAKGEVQGGTLTDMHMPKKLNTKAFKKGGLVRFEGEHSDAPDNLHAKQTTKSKLSSMIKGTKASAMHPKNADKEQSKIGMRGARQTKNTDAKETSETLRSIKMSEPAARKMSFTPGADKQVGMAIPKRKAKEGFAQGGHVKDSLAAGREKYLHENARMGQEKFTKDLESMSGKSPKKSFGYESPAAKSLKDAFYKKGGSVKKAMGGQVTQETDRGPLACSYGKPKVSTPVDHPHGEYENMKKGGKVRAKTTSPMRKAVKGRTKNVDMSTKKGNVLDVGSVKQNATPKKASMLKPKAASNGDKNSKLNVESVPKMNGMKKGGRC